MTSQVVTLKCGCIQGEYDCPEAVGLWREVSFHYGLLKGQPSAFEGWKDYDKALAKYRAHKRFPKDNHR